MKTFNVAYASSPHAHVYVIATNRIPALLCKHYKPKTNCVLLATPWKSIPKCEDTIVSATKHILPQRDRPNMEKQRTLNKTNQTQHLKRVKRNILSNTIRLALD